MLDLQTLKPILPQEVFASIEENLDTDKLREVRLRAADLSRYGITGKSAS